MEETTRHWWVLAVRGGIAIIFGLLALIWPLPTVIALAILFAIYLLIDGVTVGYHGITDRHGWWIAGGVAGVIAGIIALVWPSLTALVLLYLVAAWAVVRGVVEIVMAFRLHAAVGRGWLLGLGGAASIVFGGLAFFFPGAGLVAIVWLIGAYAIAFGVLMIAAAFEVRSAAGTMRPTPA